MKMPRRGEEVKQKVQGEGGPLKAKGMDLLCLDYCRFPGTESPPPPTGELSEKPAECAGVNG